MPKQTRLDATGKTEDDGTEGKCDASPNPTDDDGVRRSSRKRTTSKWLEGMQTSFGSPKAKMKKSSDNTDGKSAVNSESPKDVTNRPLSPRAKLTVPPRNKTGTSKKKVEAVSKPALADSGSGVVIMDVDRIHIQNEAGAEEDLTSKCDVSSVGVLDAAADVSTVKSSFVASNNSELKHQRVTESLVAESFSATVAAGKAIPSPSFDKSFVNIVPRTISIIKASQSMSDSQSSKKTYKTIMSSVSMPKVDAPSSSSLESGLTEFLVNCNGTSPRVSKETDVMKSDGLVLQASPCSMSANLDVASQEDAASIAVTLASMQAEGSSERVAAGAIEPPNQSGEETESHNVHVEIIKVPPKLISLATQVKPKAVQDTDASPVYTELTPASQATINTILANEQADIPKIDEGYNLMPYANSNAGLTILTHAAADVVPRQPVTMAPNVASSADQDTVIVSSRSASQGDESQIGFAVLEGIRGLDSTHTICMQTEVENLQRQQILAMPGQAPQWETVMVKTESSDVQPDAPAGEMTIQNIPGQSIHSGEISTKTNDVEKGEKTDLVIETVNLDDLPDEVASIIMNYTVSLGGNEETADTAAKKFRVFKVGTDGDQNILERLQSGQMIDASSTFPPSVFYDKEGNCVRLPQKFVQPTNRPMLKCSNCDYVTDKRENWYKHKRKHDGMRPYRCHMCDYRATTSSNLKRHLDTHTGVRLYACNAPNCGAKFNQKIHLDRHFTYKHMAKLVHCELCDYTCALENPDLKIHMQRKHTEKVVPEKPVILYKCGECDFDTVYKKDLRQHMKFHSKGPELKLFCEHCSFVTDCQSRLTRHLLIHTKEKPFKCGVCEYRASQKEHVIRHMRTRHKLDIHRSKQVVMKLLDENNSESQESSGDGIGIEESTDVGHDIERMNLTPVESDSSEALVGVATIVQDQEEKLETGVSTNVPDSDGIVPVDAGEFLILADKEDSKEAEDGSINMGKDTGSVAKDTEVASEHKSEELVIMTAADMSQDSHVEYPASQDSQVTFPAAETEIVTSTAETEIVTSTAETEIVTSTVTVTTESVEHLDEFVFQKSDSDNGIDSDSAQKRKPSGVYKKKYAKADFSSLPKIFNCTYCTMKFAKLINLYKHIHVQHANVYPMPPQGMYACVVCDFKTAQKKALLIHMRRHNPECEQEEAPNSLFSCVLCQYCTPKRRNLYWHLKKKHKISLMLQKDGTAKCVVEVNGPVSIVSAPTEDGAVDMQGQQVALSVEEPRGSGVPKVVNVSDLAHSLIQPKVSHPNIEDDEMDLQTIEVPMNDIKIEECIMSPEDNDAAVAIEGLQALAEQTITSCPQVVVHDSGTATDVPVDEEQQNIELSSEQVMQLSTGDYIEIDGEMYKVEFTPEEGEELNIVQAKD